MMNFIVLSSPQSTYVVYYKGNKILAIEENPESNMPQGGTVALLNAKSSKRARVFAFKKDSIDKVEIFSRVAELVGTTDFVYDIVEKRNYYIVTVVSKKIFDLVRKVFDPVKVLPFDFVVLWNIQRQLRQPLVAIRSELFYFISNDDIAISALKSEIEPYISADTVVIDAETSEEFPDLQIVSVKHRWTIDKKTIVPEMSIDVRDVEFIVNNTLDINMVRDVVRVANTEEVNSAPELKYIFSIVLVLIVYLCINLFSERFVTFVAPQIPQVSINMPSNIDLSQPTFDKFIYNKGYPYTLYEAYDVGNNKVATFVNKEEAVKWQLIHKEFALYAVTYDQNGVSNKILIAQSNEVPEGPSR